MIKLKRGGEIHLFETYYINNIIFQDNYIELLLQMYDANGEVNSQKLFGSKFLYLD